MHPTLFEVFGISIHSYGVMIAIGFLFAVWELHRGARLFKLDADLLTDYALWLMVFGIGGARLFFVVQKWDYFSQFPGEILKVWSGGLVFFGGLFGAGIFSVWFFLKHKISPWIAGDVVMPCVALAHAFGRLGCLAAGCCHGSPTDLPWAVTLHSDLVQPAMRGIPLHPVQIYEALALVILYLGLRWTQKRQQFNGQTVLTYFMAYPIIRSITEIFRGDIVRGFVVEDLISTSQFISLLTFLGALGFTFYRLKQVERTPSS
jgi:phosphatidylglycerol---prolipoprotein diacylglyceryl transferase